MRISKTHFLQQDSWTASHIRDALSLLLNNYTFGLLPPPPGVRTSLEIEVAENFIQLQTCRLVTRSGARVEIFTETGEKPNHRVSIPANIRENDHLWVVLSILPEERLPFGAPDPMELPPRSPFVKPEIQLNVRFERELDLNTVWEHQVPIARLNMLHGTATLDHDFIPPCISVTSHRKLEESYHRIWELLAQFAMNVHGAIQNINSRNLKSPMAVNTRLIAEKLFYFLADNRDNYKYVLPHQPPIELFLFLLRLVRTLNTALELIPSSIDQQKQLIQYWEDMLTDARRKDFDLLLENALQADFMVQNPRPALTRIEELLVTIDRIFSRLRSANFDDYKVELYRENDSIYEQERNADRRSPVKNPPPPPPRIPDPYPPEKPNYRSRESSGWDRNAPLYEEEPDNTPKKKRFF